MNLGNRRIKNPELKAEFESLGLLEVATFRASGNVIFGVEGREARVKLTSRVEAGLRDGLGYDVPVYLRSVEEVAAIAAHEPFPAQAIAASKGKLQVTMLLKAPTAAARRAVLALTTDQDRLALEGSELFWLPSGGTLESELDQKGVVKALGPGTQRTMGTVEQIAAKYCR
jgi:uncharacterized protein (DUF1697 family)